MNLPELAWRLEELGLTIDDVNIEKDGVIETERGAYRYHYTLAELYHILRDSYGLELDDVVIDRHSGVVIKDGTQLEMIRVVEGERHVQAELAATGLKLSDIFVTVDLTEEENENE